MSFRVEKKVLFHSSDYIKLRTLIDKYNGFKLYPKRIVKSLYFDNRQKDMFVDAEEGTLPRKKIRIRSYPDYLKKKNFLETKISSIEGRFKSTKKILDLKYNHIVKNGIFDNQYGLCYPILWVLYEREYFSFLGKRITVDKNITYSAFNTFDKYLENEIIILETKSNSLNVNDIFDKLPEFREERISKYCKGVDKIFSNQINKY